MLERASGCNQGSVDRAGMPIEVTIFPLSFPSTGNPVVGTGYGHSPLSHDQNRPWDFLLPLEQEAMLVGWLLAACSKVDKSAAVWCYFLLLCGQKVGEWWGGEWQGSEWRARWAGSKTMAGELKKAPKPALPKRSALPRMLKSLTLALCVKFFLCCFHLYLRIS